jgi:hypothetical protein
MRNSRCFLVFNNWLADVAGRKGEPPVIYFTAQGKADSYDVNHLFAREADFL